MLILHLHRLLGLFILTKLLELPVATFPSIISVPTEAAVRNLTKQPIATSLWQTKKHLSLGRPGNFAFLN